MSAKRRVLLTGATGFIGAQVASVLLSRGFEVHSCLPRLPEHSSSAVVMHEGDLLAPAEPARLIEEVRPSHLVHLAWYVEHGKFWSAPENLPWVAASLALLRAFLDRGGQRVVMAGTCFEYDLRAGWCSEDSSPLLPVSPYAVAKDALRRLLASEASRAKASWAWARIFLLYGPNEPPTRLVPSVLRDFLQGRSPPCTHGRQVRDFLHVEDVGAAIAALTQSEVQGPVNVASGEPISIRGLVEKLQRLTGATLPADFGARTAPVDDPPFLVADVRRLREEVRFLPRYSLDEGLRRLVEAQRSSVS